MGGWEREFYRTSRFFKVIQQQQKANSYYMGFIFPNYKVKQ